MNQPKVQVNKKDERDWKIIELEKNLKRKDAALAEASALLILQKKIQLIWPLKKEEKKLVEKSVLNLMRQTVQKPS